MFTCAAILLLVTSHVELRLVVYTGVGSIQGVPAHDGDYVMFLGIPYAKVNASNPFGASIPHEKFDKVFEAFNDSAICPQIQETSLDPGLYGGTLDCLNLNVYVPNSETIDRAVYLYMFGGRFVHGHNGKSLYGPKYLVRHDIIVVTINYRLGPYGFMCMDIPEIPGNQGLWDQYKAIKWVRDNIRAFGGNPQNITIGGHSSGALVVDMHLLTKQPRLFQQAIVQSGTATAPNFVGPSNTKTLISIAEKLGFITNDTYTALSFLAKVDPETIIKKATAHEYGWKPCIEKEFKGVASFIVENPEFSEETNIDGLNILGGFTFKECIYSLYSPSYKKLISKPDVILSSLERKFNFKNDSNVVNIVKHFYLGDDTDRKSNKYKIVDFLSDFEFVYPIQRQFNKYAKHKNTNVYIYLFSYEGHLNRFRRLYNITDAGATHSDELGYIFTMDIVPDIPNINDQRMIDQMSALWTNFIKYGNPTPNRTELLPVSWPPLTANTVPCLQIDSNLTVISRPFRRNIAFWDLFYDAHLDKLKMVSEGRQIIKNVQSNSIWEN